jgi:hypothetical protein
VIYETELWPFVQARYQGAKRTNPVRLIVVHTPEWPESPSGAEAVARYFATMSDGRVASAHIVVDSDSIVQCVKDSFVADAAPGANHDGIQVELVGVASQTRAQWRDKYSLATLALGADAVAQYCLKYGIPPVHLTDDQLLKGSLGIVGHDQVSRVYKKSTHTDPGKNFPWTRFSLYVKGSYADREAGL